MQRRWMQDVLLGLDWALERTHDPGRRGGRRTLHITQDTQRDAGHATRLRWTYKDPTQNNGKEGAQDTAQDANNTQKTKV